MDGGLQIPTRFRIRGIKGDGLTALQFANNLVFLGICEPPSPASVANWIAANGKLGAFHGLDEMGFSIRTSDPLVVRAAFFCVIVHMDKFLSPKAKEALEYSPIFVEHVLCKVKRWISRFKSKIHAQTFISLVQKLVEEAATATESHKLLPIPVHMTREAIEEAIQLAKVCTNHLHPN